MDNLDWNATPITGSASSSWKNQQQQIKESLMMLNSYRFAAPSSSRVDAFNQIQQQIANDDSSSSASLAMNVQEFGAAFDPIHILSSWNISQRQEAATRLAADSVAAKSGTGSSSSPSFPPQKNYMPQLGYNQFGVCGLMSDPGSNSLFSKSKSPDCLLSATNISNTDTNDGISVIFSNDSKTLWNIKTDNNAVSSRESAIHAFNWNPPKRCNTAKRNHDHAVLEPGSSTKDSKLISKHDQPKSKKSRSEYKFPISSSHINFHQASSSSCSIDEADSEAIAQMKEMMYRAAVLRPVSSIDTERVMAEKPKRKNVRISTDPQTAAARRRRERISERIRVLQKLVPGGNNMDTASMLDEAANYIKFLRTQVNALEAFGFNIDPIIINNNFTSLSSIPFNYPFPMQPQFPLQNLNPIHHPKC